MTQTPAGWYPDPDPSFADRPGRLRYWDGQRWTEHIHEPEPPQPPAPEPMQQPTPPAAQPPGYPVPGEQTTPPAYPAYGDAQQQPYTHQQYGQYPAYPAQPTAPYGQAPYEPSYTDKATTPDGVPLAGWWWRVLAVVLDSIIALPLYAVAVIPVVASQWDALEQWVDDQNYAIENNTADPPTPDIFDITTGPGLALSLSLFGAYLLYTLVFLFWKQATPGKLILGMRVRLRESPDLPASAILARVGFVVLGQICGLLLLLDYLWPLWDSKKQALHDKVARTNVVKP